MTDITESDIPNLSDGELNRLVAGWADESNARSCGACGGIGLLGSFLSRECGACEGTGAKVEPPDYCNDDAAAWRLLERMPRAYVFISEGRSLNLRRFPRYEQKKRILAEAAGILALRGVEPVEVGE